MGSMERAGGAGRGRWRRREILQFIRGFTQREGYPPTLREIGAAVGLAPSTVSYHRSVLEERGYLRHGAGLPRTAVEPGDLAIPSGSGDGVEVPLVGRIAAGVPVLAEQMIEDTFSLPRKVVGEGTLFMLRVAGDSMAGAGIADGDLVVVREQPAAENGEIVAAAVTSGGDAEATVKTLRRANGHVWLIPHNPSYAPIPADDVTIFGKVVAVLRCRVLPAQQLGPGDGNPALQPPGGPWRERGSTAGGWPAAWSRTAGARGQEGGDHQRGGQRQGGDHHGDHQRHDGHGGRQGAAAAARGETGRQKGWHRVAPRFRRRDRHRHRMQWTTPGGSHRTAAEGVLNG
jgi:repressor LexA